MFICQKCHKEKREKKRKKGKPGHTWEEHILNKGIATCEICGKRTICVDCQVRVGNL